MDILLHFWMLDIASRNMNHLRAMVPLLLLLLSTIEWSYLWKSPEMLYVTQNRMSMNFLALIYELTANKIEKYEMSCFHFNCVLVGRRLY